MGVIVYVHCSSSKQESLIPEDLKFYTEDGFKSRVLYLYWTFNMHPKGSEDDEENTSVCSLSDYITKFFPSWEEISAGMQESPSFYPIQKWTREDHEKFKSDLEVYYSIDPAGATMMFTE